VSRRNGIPVALLAGTLALSGCGHSPQTHLLTLDLVPPVSPPADYSAPPVRVTAVRIPAALDRLEFVQAVAPGELQIRDQYRWSASIGELAREALMRDLSARLPNGSVLPLDTPAVKGSRHADVAILALTAAPEQTTMDAIVTVAVDGSDRIVRRHVTLTQKHATNALPERIASDYGMLLGKVADEIVFIVQLMQAGKM